MHTATPDPVEDCRETAFLALPEPGLWPVYDRLLDENGRPFGPPLCKLTPWRHYLLLGYDSPYAVGGRADRNHLLQALYLCGPAFRPGSRIAFAFFRLRWLWFSIRRGDGAALALVAWLNAPFKLMPPVPVPDKREGAATFEADDHWLASIMLIGRQCGLSAREALHTPYAVLWPLLAAKWLHSGDGARPKFNRQRDRQIKEYLRARRARGGRP